MEQPIVSAVTCNTSQAKVTITGVPDSPGIAASLFRALADDLVNVDMIVQNTSLRAPPTSRSPSRTKSWRPRPRWLINLHRPSVQPRPCRREHRSSVGHWCRDEDPSRGHGDDVRDAGRCGNQYEMIGLRLLRISCVVRAIRPMRRYRCCMPSLDLQRPEPPGAPVRTRRTGLAPSASDVWWTCRQLLAWFCEYRNLWATGQVGASCAQS